MDPINPLRQPRPAKSEALYTGRFFPARPNGKYESDAAFVRFRVMLTSRTLWISKELSIPVPKIKDVEIIDAFMKKAIAITYENPITGGLERFIMCKLDPLGIGLQLKTPLLELANKLDEVRKMTPSEPKTRGNGEMVDGFLAPESYTGKSDQESQSCEICGAKPAYYIGHVFLVGALLMWFRSGEQRRIHCKKHLLWAGGWRYLVTTATGWLGISIIAYPFLVIRTGLNLKPAVGKWSYLLAILPLPIVAYAIYAFLESSW